MSKLFWQGHQETVTIKIDCWKLSLFILNYGFHFRPFTQISNWLQRLYIDPAPSFLHCDVINERTLDKIYPSWSLKLRLPSIIKNEKNDEIIIWKKLSYEKCRWFKNILMCSFNTRRFYRNKVTLGIV